MTDAPAWVLVHGAWHDGRCWAPLLAEPAARDHRPTAVDLPGDRPGVGAAGYADAVLAAAPPGPLVLVGHSLGGLTAPVVAQRLPPARVVALVLLAPLLPEPGTSSDERTRAGHGLTVDGFGAGLRRHDDRTTSWPTQVAGTGLYAGVAAELGPGGPDVVARAIAGLRSQAWTVTREITPLTAWPPVPTTIVVCAADRVVDPARLRAAARQVPGAAVVDIPGGHFPMVTRPADLAAVLVAAVHGI